jgi:hypothetical protein
MSLEQLVAYLAGETGVLGENVAYCRFVHHKPLSPDQSWNPGQVLTAWASALPPAKKNKAEMITDASSGIPSYDPTAEQFWPRGYHCRRLEIRSVIYLEEQVDKRIAS